MKIKRIFIYAVCVAGAVYMFYLGVATERRWASDRMKTQPDLNLETTINAEAVKKQDVQIDVTKLGYPEELTKSAAEEAQTASKQEIPARAPSAEENSSQVIYIQLGAYKGRDNALNAAAVAKRNGFNVEIYEKGGQSGAIIYFVRIGPFKNLNKASPAIEKLKRNEVAYLIITEHSGKPIQ